MAYQLQTLLPVSSSDLRDRIDQLLDADAPRLRRLWDYYANPSTRAAASGAADRPYRQAQEAGLPLRLTGDPALGTARKEVVIENDISWRIDTLVDYLFGRPLVLNSAAPDPSRRATIESLLRLVLAQHGGVTFLQHLALLGSVYGFVDVLVKLVDLPEGAETGVGGYCGTGVCGTRDVGQPPVPCDNDRNGSRTDKTCPDGAGPSEEPPGRPASPPPHAGPAPATDEPSPATAPASAAPASSGSSPRPDAALALLARRIRLEIVDPVRALPLLAPDDYRAVLGYAQVYYLPRSCCTRSGHSRPPQWSGREWLRKLLPRLRDPHLRDPHLRDDRGEWPDARDEVLVVELVTPAGWQRYEDERLVESGDNSLAQIPLVHVQNTALPFRYAGGSDVEPLVPLQDELNTRLSDRAHRITLQSFRMYLGKGVEHFDELPVAPGRMWATDNEQAEVIEFGGDAHCPSEESHIRELREALDKASGVTPIAAGAVEGRIGRLTSAAALRVTLQALLAKTERKRTTYGAAIERMCELALLWLDRAGLFRTDPAERRVELHWPSPIPESAAERLQEAESKLRLGVAREVVLRELGY